MTEKRQKTVIFRNWNGTNGLTNISEKSNEILDECNLIPNYEKSCRLFARRCTENFQFSFFLPRQGLRG